jgi:hypothetical protein
MNHPSSSTTTRAATPIIRANTTSQGNIRILDIPQLIMVGVDFLSFVLSFFLSFLFHPSP